MGRGCRSRDKCSRHLVLVNSGFAHGAGATLPIDLQPPVGGKDRLGLDFFLDPLTLHARVHGRSATAENTKGFGERKCTGP